VNIQLPHSCIYPFEPHGIPILRGRSDTDIYEIISADLRAFFKLLKKTDKEEQRSNVWLHRVAALMKFRALESGATDVKYEIRVLKDTNDYLEGFEFVFHIVINESHYERHHLLWL